MRPSRDFDNCTLTLSPYLTAVVVLTLLQTQANAFCEKKCGSSQRHTHSFLHPSFFVHFTLMRSSVRAFHS